MSTADLVAIMAFLAFVLLGLFIMTLQKALRQRPAGRVRDRLKNAAQLIGDPRALQAIEDLDRAERDARRRHRRASMGTLGRYISRIETVSGKRGVYTVAASVFIALIAMAALSVLYLPLPWWAKVLLTLATPAVVAVAVYRRLNEKFRLAFLEQLPDILDMIIRASQAGVPVTQSIRGIGEEFGAPAGPEFRRVGDNLYLGNDMATVLEEAEARIQLPDFSFLAVCLLLQRETGGSLSETLSNLANVVRSRRDLRLKTRALTAEGRLAGAVISVIPVFILIIMSMTNPSYVAVLFDTPTGNMMLMVAAAMLIIGSLAIRKIAKLEV